jgi:5-methylcytosine-specific restriction endonuclease McrA
MWVKLDDRQSGSDAVLRAWVARRSPLGLHHMALLHVGAQETDGAIDPIPVELWVPSRAERRRFTTVLVECGLWVADGGGWRLPGHLDTNPSREDVQRRRAADTKRKALARNRSLLLAVRTRDGEFCRYCGDPVTFSPARNRLGATYDLVDPEGPVRIENVVVSCRPCNGEKALLTVGQAGMVLLPEPAPQLSLSGRTSAGRPPAQTRPDQTRERL